MASMNLAQSLPSTFPHTYRFRLSAELVRTFKDPVNEGIAIHHAYIPISEFKRELLPDDVNPRSHEEMSGRVPKAIEASVAQTPEDFHLLNRGILILAQSCTYDNSAKMLEIRIDDAENGGVADGGTTDRVLARMLDAYVLKNQKMTAEEMIRSLSSAFVHVEIISGNTGDKIVALASARNTSNQVQEFALDNLGKKFDWLKTVIETSQLSGRVRYRENDPQPVDVRTILAILTMFHPMWESEKKEPVVSFAGKGQILSYFRDEEWLPGYRQLRPVVIDILELFDHVHAKFQEQYIVFNRAVKDSDSKFGRRREVGRGKILPLTETQVKYSVPDGWLYPVVASLRMLLDFTDAGGATWNLDPFEYFNEYGYELVGDVMDQSAIYGYNPQTVGKSRPVWAGLRGRVKLKRMELEQARP